MRLIDADECFDHDPYYYDNEYDKYAYDLISAQPTVEAIPVERLARVFATSHLEKPCHYKFGIIKHQSDQFCVKCIEHDSEECWLHAFKEGWLDE